ncbi:putative glycoside hydrolase [Feifania hominis]|uniref:DUF4015 domain-containing protein n=1 Tax=Feifania hominis TaxID=2763660 RepID=A0A926HU01_9FIRM|nr:putative glycoside hydrolase [Feifania hominis]MBC8536389.1 hypothetical protein [Feifania hominis]
MKYNPRYRGRKNRHPVLIVVVLLLAALVGFFYFSYQNNEDFRQSIQNLFSALRGDAKPVEPADPDPTPGPEPGSDNPQPVTPPDDPQPTANTVYRIGAVSSASLYSAEIFEKELNALKEQGYTAVLLNVKPVSGKVVYASTAAAALADSTADLTALLSLCEQYDMTPIAQMSCFEDNSAYRKIPDAAVRTKNKVYWLDGNNRRWISPYSEQSLGYLADIAEELAALGLRDVLLTSVTFPTYGKTGLIGYTDVGNTDRTAAILTFLDGFESRLGESFDSILFAVPSRALTDSAYAQNAGLLFPEERFPQSHSTFDAALSEDTVYYALKQ